MTKKDLISAVWRAHPELKRSEVERAIETFFHTIRQTLIHRHRVELRGFGVFCVRVRGAHRAHNPQTGEHLFVPEKVVPFFKASCDLKDSLKQAVAAPADMRSSDGDGAILST